MLSCKAVGYLHTGNGHLHSHCLSNTSPGCVPPPLPGEVLLGDLARAGFSITAEHEEADAILVNTCAFVEDAKAESLEVGGALAAAAARLAAESRACHGAQPSICSTAAHHMSGGSSPAATHNSATLG